MKRIPAPSPAKRTTHRVTTKAPAEGGGRRGEAPRLKPTTFEKMDETFIALRGAAKILERMIQMTLAEIFTLSQAGFSAEQISQMAQMNMHQSPTGAGDIDPMTILAMGNMLDHTTPPTSKGN